MTAASKWNTPLKLPCGDSWMGRAPFTLGDGRCTSGRNGSVHRGDIPGYGSKHLHKECRANVGKGHLPAGIGNNLQRPIDEGNRSRWEGFGLAHEPV
jgi:hypothetical protein